MTLDILTDLGEEYGIKNGFDGATADILLYNDSEDDVQEGDDLAAIDSEPGNPNYARKQVTLGAADRSGDWGVENGAAFEFDFSDTSGTDTVDAFGVVISFQAEDTGDSSATEHLVATAALRDSDGDPVTVDVDKLTRITVQQGEISITL